MTNLAISLKLNELINQHQRQPLRIAMSAYQELINYIDILINDNARHYDGFYSLSFDDLTSAELDKLIALKIEDDGRETSELFYQSNKFAEDDDLTDALVNMLKDKAKQKDFMAAIRNHVLDYYKESLRELIDQRCAIHGRKYYE